MLTIGKTPVFGPDNMAIAGQYNPDIPGWRLRLFSRGREDFLYMGTLHACKRLMADCHGLASIDEMRSVIASYEQGETAELPPSRPAQPAPGEA